MTSRLILIALSVISSLHAEDTEALFVRRVWPMFQEKCLACHGNDETKIKGGLDMRTLALTLKGGDSEVAALVAGKADESPLYLASTRTHDDWEPMPPKENDRLTDEQLGWLKEWINGGAPWPDEARRVEVAKASSDKWSAEDGITVKTVGALSPDWANRRYKPESLWAYQPVKKPALEVSPSRHPIDALIEKKIPQGVLPAQPADACAFIRRATFDLTGLPPTPEEVNAFVSQMETGGGSNAPYVNLINRLLNSPHYGERMARHWLDVARYADSSGFANDYERGNAWRYRDYVVRSFNEDKPYHQFIKEQVAGDEMAGEDALIATGFLRMGPWELTGMEVAKIARQRFLDDVTNSVGETFLAHSLQCARCHDHKFDPVPTHDYYAMQACFSTTQLAERPAPFTVKENTAGFEERKYLEQRYEGHLAALRDLDNKMLINAEKWFAEKKLDRSDWDSAVASARAFIQGGGKPQGKVKSKGKTKNFAGVFEIARGTLQKRGVPEDQYPPKLVGFEPVDFGNERVARKGLERLKWELERYEPFAFSVYNGRTPQMTSVNQPMRIPEGRMSQGELEQTTILGGGDPFSPTKHVQPGILTALFETADLPASIPTEIEGRRTALADWIANEKNPLTTRTIVNRIWLWHFGQALAGNPNNFGSTGKKPTNPELLDWLAATFVEKGWSFKEMHRIMMTSDAYKRSAELTTASASSAMSREELEASYAVFKPRRLTAEELRDTMLKVTGELNPTLGGIPNRPEINLEVALQPRQVMGTFASAWVPNPLPAQRHRRSLYALKIRGVRDPFMEVFNEPGPDFSCEAREISTVTPQVFSLFNGQASYDRALALANRVVKEAPVDVIGRVIELAYGRPGTADEKAACDIHWKQMQTKHDTLVFTPKQPPLEIIRDAVEENTGEKFSFREKLHAYADFVPDLQPGDVDARTRALADVCLVLLNSNEFAYVY
ncbi:cytochrome c [Prosthecobacter fusiformis]|uniref:Cytochrome c n=1 Tax=Prosthecobacter fusiformis TaxID=48464 RepID=A0A4R7SRD1_9BACT|nr:PSD1 and planctomycete cytochrome C domain-containing protein [Prosthecobacter fusiformis]TDU81159.1 cytochrome c [Prosthecobacter fusiformis]